MHKAHGISLYFQEALQERHITIIVALKIYHSFTHK